MNRALVAFVVLSATLLCGCLAVGNNANTQAPTTGQQLIDLKTALDRGAITQAEYDQKKAQIMATK